MEVTFEMVTEAFNIFKEALNETDKLKVRKLSDYLTTLNSDSLFLDDLDDLADLNDDLRFEHPDFLSMKEFNKYSSLFERLLEQYLYLDTIEVDEGPIRKCIFTTLMVL